MVVTLFPCITKLAIENSFCNVNILITIREVYKGANAQKSVSVDEYMSSHVIPFLQFLTPMNFFSWVWQHNDEYLQLAYSDEHPSRIETHIHFLDLCAPVIKSTKMKLPSNNEIIQTKLSSNLNEDKLIMQAWND